MKFSVAPKSTRVKALAVTVRSPCLSGVRVLGFLRGVVPKKEVDHV